MLRLSMGPIAVDAPAMRVLRASPDVVARLRTAPPEAGRVHSVFERALNLAWHDGRLLTLQGPERLLAPFAATVERLPHPGALRAGVSARRLADTLSLGGTRFEWRDATTVDTAMPESDSAPGPTLAVLLAEPPAESGPVLSSATGRSARSRLAEGVRRRDPGAFLEGALGLVGLGEGLTPAGDDCLVGALAVLHRFSRSWLRAHPQIEASVSRAAATTTLVAGEFIVHALAGHFAESLLDLMTADSSAAAARAAERLLRTGATSGADALHGVRLALTALGASRP
ncbi:MAG TPA: DUF2877 domain-containing protein [Gemmatimonadales bacterium]|nr:DUF2877 domain-containing protein [Gemmatimonadales bacterium]